ncbi:MAG: hypothetical protein U0903_20120 [Planctomycetales bacterium]
MFPSTVDRVPANTSDEINAQIRRQTEESIRAYQHAGKARVRQRLQELDEEWDIERTLEANASTLMLAGLTLGITVNKKFLAIPVLVSGFLLQHALQGWCPPLPILRRMGFRTASEIDEEKYALKQTHGV